MEGSITVNLLNDKVAVITGANSGVGAAAAKLFAAEGASVVICARRAEPLEAVAKEIEEAGGQALCVPTDISDKASVQAMVDKALSRFGKIDILVNNAGVLDATFAGIATFDDGEMDRMLSINTKGTMNCIRAVITHMTRGASIVNVNSIGASKGTAGVTYSASKAAILGVTRQVAMCYASEGIRCNAVCPGGINTPMTAEMDYSKMDMGVMAAIGKHTDGEIPASDPQEVANVVLLLACDLSATVTGQWITADKGGSL